MSLTKLLRDIKKFSGITDNSEEVGKNYIFVAIRGLKNDGHSYITDAIKKGATFVIGEKNVKVSGAPYLKVEDAREVLGELASAFYGYPSKKLKVIGVTGTKGKTTTVHLIYHILSESGEKAGLVSTISAKIGNRESDTGFHVTSPGVVSIHKFLAEMVDKKCKYAVVEVSSHGIEQKRIAGIQFYIGVLTNIAPEHLDYHKTFDEYKKVKMMFINSAKHKIIAPEKTDLSVLPGEFNNLNLEAAVAAVSLLGLGRQKAIKAIESFKLPPGRLEEIKNNRGIRVFVDFAHTPESLEVAILYLRNLTKGRIISMFGCAGERDPFKRPRMGEVAAKYSDAVILTSEDPRTEKPEDIISQIRSGMPKSFLKVYEIVDREEAIKKSIDLAQKGDVVGLFGKGHEKSMNLDGKEETPWSDQEVARKFLK